MSSSYKHLRCPGCDGTLTYKKEKKVWECIYCGNEIRREEEYDGLYTIKNVVKQVLVDLGYGRVNSAMKNLVECQKISSDYVGTLIAEICLKVYMLITPGECQQSEIKGILGQIKRLYEKVETISGGTISAEEEALYESFDNNSDALGVLVLVYDTIQAKMHLEFVLNLFDASTVYSKSLNANLLNYALKNNMNSIVDEIFSNSDNVNCREAFFILLNSYDDSENKRIYITSIAPKAEFRPEDYRKIEEYIIKSADCLDTKILTYVNAVEHNITPPMQSMVNLLNDTAACEEQIAKVFQTFSKTKPKDAELYELITEIYAKHMGEVANFEMQELLNSNLYIKLTDKTVRSMINRKELSIDERIGLLEKAEKCKLDNKANDSILAEVLLHNNEATNIRQELVKKIIEYVDTISTNVLTEYIIKCNNDGENKPEMLETLLSLNLNMSFFRDVPSNYMKKSQDDTETKKRVVQLLGNHGLSVDGDFVLEMACIASEDDYLDKAEYIQKSIQNGTRIGADHLNRYLESVAPQKYHSEFISLLNTPISRISDKALAKYVLYFTEDYQVKLQNALVFAEKNGKSFGDSICEIKHLNSSITCNLFQAYVLCTEDSAVLVDSMVNAMKTAHAKLNLAIIVNGKSMKFKKYISDNKGKLSPLTLQLCESNNVFSFFF